jgi:hypothetical protein
MAPGNYFPPPALKKGRLCIAKGKIVARLPSSALLRPLPPRARGAGTPAAGARRLRLRLVIAVKAAMGAADPPAERHPP